MDILFAQTEALPMNEYHLWTVQIAFDVLVVIIIHLFLKKAGK